MKNFERCLGPLLKHEGGNDDDPQDPGGRTSRGIIQSEYNRYRTGKGKPQRDVWSADDSEVREIYKIEYWDKMRCDELPSGVDYCVFDFGVNSGVSRSAKFLQENVGAEVDGEIGPETINHARAAPAGPLVDELCNDRMDFLRGLRTWGRFGDGWTTRVREVRALAQKMALEVPSAKVESKGWLTSLLELLGRLFRDTSTGVGGQAKSQTPWMQIATREIGFHEIGENMGIEKYVEGGKTGGSVGEPWCADFANYCLETSGVPGTRSAMARSFAESSNFVKLDGPAYGAIVVMWRGSPSGRSGHVYFYKGETDDGNIGLGGNQKDSVCEQLQPKSRVVGYYWPRSVPLPKIGPIRIESEASEGSES